MAVSDELSLLLRKLDLKPMQYMVLALIEANPKIQQGSAAEILGIQKTNFVAIVTNLSELGLNSVQLISQRKVVLVSLLDLEYLGLQLRNKQILLV